MSFCVGCIGHVQSNRDLRRGDYQAAADRLEALVADSPDSQSLRLDLARAYLYLGRDTEALDELGRITPSYPRLWRAGLYEGLVPALSGDAAGAQTALAESIEIPGRLRMKRQALKQGQNLAVSGLGRTELLDQAERVAEQVESAERRRELEARQN
jgi:predicted Zn-dependent protease